MKILARANKKLRGNGKFYTIPEPTKSWFYVTEYDSNGYFKAKTIGYSGAMPYRYMYGCPMTSNTFYPNISTRLLREFEINDGVTSIGDSAFQSCSSLQSITIPDSVTSIESSAFYQCSSLKSITIPDSVTSIGANAFNNCTGLTSVTFGRGLTNLSTGVFAYSSKLTLFDFRKATQVPTLSGTNAFYNTPTSKKIVVPDSLYDSWITATNWSSTSYNIVNCIIKASDYEATL